MVTEKNQWEELQQKNSALRKDAEIEKAKHLENLKTQEHARAQLRKEVWLFSDDFPNRIIFRFANDITFSMKAK